MYKHALNHRSLFTWTARDEKRLHEKTPLKKMQLYMDAFGHGKKNESFIKRISTYMNAEADYDRIVWSLEDSGEKTFDGKPWNETLVAEFVTYQSFLREIKRPRKK